MVFTDGSNRAIKRQAGILFWRKPFVYLYAVFLTAVLIFAFYGFFSLAEGALSVFASVEFGSIPYLTAFFFVAVPAALGLIRFLALDVSVGGISVFEILYYFSSGKNFLAAWRFCLSALIFVAPVGLFAAFLFALSARIEPWLKPFLCVGEITFLCVVTEIVAFVSLFVLFFKAVELVNASFVFVRCEELGVAFAFEQAERFSEGGASLVASFLFLAVLTAWLNKFLLLLLVPYFLLSVLIGFETRRDSGFSAGA